jgi:hypothetical protein
MGITEEIRGECGETYRRMSAKGAPICCARAAEVIRDSTGYCRCWRDLLGWLLAWRPRQGYASLSDATGPTGIGSAALVEGGMITPTA